MVGFFILFICLFQWKGLYNLTFDKKKLEWLPILKHSAQNAQESKKEGNDQESIQSSTTPEPGYQWESDNFTIRHHRREPAGDHKALINRHARKHNKIKTEIT